MKNANGAFNEDIHMGAKFTEIRDNFNLNTVIETGTYHGVTTEWFANHFDNVYTVECNEVYHKEANERISQYKNIKSYLQDSPDFLKDVLGSDKIKSDKTIIFLDAHWYTNPVLNELIAIKNSGKKPILAIHDFKVPNRPEFGYDIYPDQGIVYEWEWIKEYIESIYGIDGYTKEYNQEAIGAMRGCIFIYPNKK
jgi:hypothetical protein